MVQQVSTCLNLHCFIIIPTFQYDPEYQHFFWYFSSFFPLGATLNTYLVFLTPFLMTEWWSGGVFSLRGKTNMGNIFTFRTDNTSRGQRILGMLSSAECVCILLTQNTTLSSDAIRM